MSACAMSRARASWPTAMPAPRASPASAVLITGPGRGQRRHRRSARPFPIPCPCWCFSSVNARDDLGKGRGRLHEITRPAGGDGAADRLQPHHHGAGGAAQAPWPMPMRCSRRGGRARSISRSRSTCWPGPAIAAADSRGKRRRRRRRTRRHRGRGAADRRAPGSWWSSPAAARVGCRPRAAGASSRRPARRADSNRRRQGRWSPTTIPQSLGSTLPLAATQELLAEADLVIAVGTELAETDHWIDRLPIAGQAASASISMPRTLTRDYKPDVGILADAGAALARAHRS